MEGLDFSSRAFVYFRVPHCRIFTVFRRKCHDNILDYILVVYTRRNQIDISIFCYNSNSNIANLMNVINEIFLAFSLNYIK